jgi:peroxiredoxin
MGVVFGAPLALAEASFGPKPGVQAPAIGALPDQYGKPKTLEKLGGPRGTVLMFYRSAGWCPFCQAQLIAMNEGAAAIERRGYKIVGISYDEPSVTKAFTERRKIGYALLSDPKSEVIDRWGLRDPAYAPGTHAYGVPRPIIFVIDRHNTIRASLAEETFKTRPPVAVVIETLDSLK